MTVMVRRNTCAFRYEYKLDPRYKTELCKRWEDCEKCKWGKHCMFAHGSDELRDRSHHKKFKTLKCVKFHELGICQYGSRCSFIHDDSFFQEKQEKRLGCFKIRAK